MLQCDTVCCSVIQCEVLCRVNNDFCAHKLCSLERDWQEFFAVLSSVLLCAALRCSVLQCVAVCCSVVQRVVVCGSVL